MRVKLVLVAVVSLLFSFVAGCATFDGLRMDVEQAIGSVSGGQSHTPSEACEPVYQREGVNSAYKQCLTRQIMAGLSEEEKDNLRFVRAYPSCIALYKNKRASLDQYRTCQVAAFVRSERDRLVTWREDLRKRDRQESSRTSGRRSSKKVAGS